MLYLNRDFPVEVRDTKGGEMICIVLGEGKREILIPIPRTMNNCKMIKKGLHSELSVVYSRSCKPRIIYSSKETEKYLFAIIDSKTSNYSSSTINIEYEQYRCATIDRLLSITSTNDIYYWESALVKIPNNGRVKFIKVSSDNKDTYIVSDINGVFEISNVPDILDPKWFNNKFDISKTNIKPLDKVIEELENTTGSDKELLEFIIENRR